MDLLGDRRQIAARTPMPTHDVSNSTYDEAIGPETITFADGVAGTEQYIKFKYDGIMALKRDRLAQDGDTSLVFAGGTVLTTEVPWRFKDTPGKDDHTSRLATLANGEYMVDYENGFALGKNAITTATATDTVTYRVRLSAVSVVLPSDVTDSYGAGAVDTGTQRVTLASNDPAVTNLATIATYQGTMSTSLANIDTNTSSTAVSAAAAAASLSVLDDWDDGDKAKVSNRDKYTPDISAALEVGSVIYSGACRLRKMRIRMDSTATGGTYYLQIVADTAGALPSDGAVIMIVAPEKIIHVNGADTYVDLDFSPGYVDAPAGACWVWSTTEYTKTVIGTPWGSGTALYEIA